MRRLLATYLAVCALLFGAGLCFQQIPSRAGTMTLLGVGAPKTSGGVAFQGPGDIISGAKGYWGFVCYNTAYTGNMADIFDLATGSTTETLLTCSSGGGVNQTINPLSTTCASGCVIATYYDQSGAANCSGACNFTQATNSLRHKLVQSCSGSVLCADMSIANSTYLTPNIGTTINQPYTFSITAKRTGSFTSTGGLLTQSSNNIQSRFDSSASQMLIYAGGAGGATAAATDSAWHGLQFVFNDAATDDINVDGTANSIAFGTIGTLALPSANPLVLGANSGAPGVAALVGNGISFGAWPIAFSGAQSISMNTNQHTNCGC